MSRELQRSFVTILPKLNTQPKMPDFGDFESTACWEAGAVQSAIEAHRDEQELLMYNASSAEQGVHHLAQLTLDMLIDRPTDEVTAPVFPRAQGSYNYCWRTEGSIFSDAMDAPRPSNRIRNVIFYDEVSGEPTFVQMGNGEAAAMNVVPVAVSRVVDGLEVLNTYKPGWLFGLHTTDLQQAQAGIDDVTKTIDGHRKNFATLMTDDFADVRDERNNVALPDSSVRGVRPLRISVFGIPDPDVRIENAVYFALNADRLLCTTAETTFHDYARRTLAIVAQPECDDVIL